ncbi:hypothetical protein FAES_3920 [Fibrella aestuarina BUZ 2]|uniref:Uncharacterized protein n=1 Tax=Fibrella aestuarina BUZ 2 TaxID=1166018 RepID=I0KCS3_9BACT|nr:hypothetical protein [Fibrella aestuarina]CCH01926.1 hypothetical protein FAES_3920 [Fibrella aestuarina BUZ 2]
MSVALTPIDNERMYLVVNPDGTAEPSTLTTDYQSTMALLSLYDQHGIGKPVAETFEDGAQILPVRVTIQPDGTADDALAAAGAAVGSDETVLYLARLLATVSMSIRELTWDRYVDDGEGGYEFFGWLPRTDGQRDFLLIMVYPGVGLSFTTSSAKYSKRIAQALGLDDTPHNPCTPIADLFGRADEIEHRLNNGAAPPVDESKKEVLDTVISEIIAAHTEPLRYRQATYATYPLEDQPLGKIRLTCGEGPGEGIWVARPAGADHVVLQNDALNFYPNKSIGVILPTTGNNYDATNLLNEGVLDLHPEAWQQYLEHGLIDASGRWLGPSQPVTSSQS